MKKQRLDMKFSCNGDQQMFIVKENQKAVDVDLILNTIRAGIKTKEIDACGKVMQDNSVKYNFTISQYNEITGKNEKGIISIKVLNEDSKKAARILGTLDDFMEISASIKKVNRNRILALVGCGLAFTSMFGGSILTIIGEKLQQDYEFTHHDAPAQYYEMSDDEIREQIYNGLDLSYEIQNSQEEIHKTI